MATSDTESVEDHGSEASGDESVVEEPSVRSFAAVRPQSRETRAAFAELDQVDLPTIFVKRAAIVETVSHSLKSFAAMHAASHWGRSFSD